MYDEIMPKLELGRLLTLEESQAEAMEHIRQRPNLRNASVKMSVPADELCIEVAGSRKLWDLAWPLVEAPWPRFFGEVQRTVHHFELYQPNRKNGFILRVVRRGITESGGSRFYDLAEFLFRVPPDPPMLEWEGKGMAGPIPFEDPMTPQLLGELLSHAKEACIMACSTQIDFTGLRIGSTVIRRPRTDPTAIPKGGLER